MVGKVKLWQAVVLIGLIAFYGYRVSQGWTKIGERAKISAVKGER